MTNKNETVEQVCNAIMHNTEKNLPRHGYDTAILQRMKSYTGRILSAYKRDLSAKDADIARLKQELFENQTQAGSMLIGRDALIKELADALDSRLCDYACEIHGECLAGDDMNECQSVKYRALVAKAREVVK